MRNLKRHGKLERRLIRKLWLTNRCGKNERRRKRRKERKRNKFRHLCHNKTTAQSITQNAAGRVTIVLPERLDFEENYATTARHFASLRRAVKLRRRMKGIIFDNIRYVSPSAALVLASEVDIWSRGTFRGLKADHTRWHPDIKRLLWQMGYFELLGIPPPSGEVERKNTTFLKFKRGRVGDDGSLAKMLRLEIEKLIGEPIQKDPLFVGLSEAITNVAQHAYDLSGDEKHPFWWLSASFEENDRFLCVTFYDRGRGIPKTLPNSKLWELIKDTFWQSSDAERIRTATHVGRSSSGRRERGKGLQNLIEFAKAHREGRLRIYSLRGMYEQQFTNPNGTSSAMSSRQEDYSVSVGGTLIEWAVYL